MFLWPKRAGIVAVIGQFVAAGVAEHVGMGLDAEMVVRSIFRENPAKSAAHHEDEGRALALAFGAAGAGTP